MGLSDWSRTQDSNFRTSGRNRGKIDIMKQRGRKCKVRGHWKLNPGPLGRLPILSSYHHKSLVVTLWLLGNCGSVLGPGLDSQCLSFPPITSNMSSLFALKMLWLTHNYGCVLTGTQERQFYSTHCCH